MRYAEGDMDQGPESKDQSPENQHQAFLRKQYLEGIGRVLSGGMTAEQLADILTARELELENRADHDGLLPDFYNRNGFIKELSGAIELTKRKPELTGSLLALDIDQFKRFNDAFGHPQGDKLLETYAQVIKEQTRDADIWGRLGGDELAVYLIECDSAQAKEVAQRIRQATTIAIKEKFPDLTWEQTISVGVTQLEENDTPESLRERADKALYEAKQSTVDQGKIKIHLSTALSPSSGRKMSA